MEPLSHPPLSIDLRLEFANEAPIIAVAMTSDGRWLLEAREGAPASLRPLPQNDALLPMPPELTPTLAAASEGRAAFGGPHGAWIMSGLDARPGAEQVATEATVGLGFQGEEAWLLKAQGPFIRFPEGELASALKLPLEDPGHQGTGLPFLAAAAIPEGLGWVSASSPEDQQPPEGGRFDSLQVWGPTGTKTRSILHSSSFASLSCSPDANCCAALSTQGQMNCFALPSGEAMWASADKLRVPMVWLGAWLISATTQAPGVIALWSATGDGPFPLHELPAPITALATSGIYLLVGCADGKTLIFSARKPR